MGCHSLLQGLFPTQRLNQGLLFYRQTLYRLSHYGSPQDSLVLCLFRFSSISFIKVFCQEVLHILIYSRLGFPGGSVVKNLSAIQETWVWSLGQEDPLQKRMATHSCILAWRIPWTEEPGGLQSKGSQRVRHNWMNNTSTFIFQLQILFLGFYSKRLGFISFILYLPSSTQWYCFCLINIGCLHSEDYAHALLWDTHNVLLHFLHNECF